MERAPSSAALSGQSIVLGVVIGVGVAAWSVLWLRYGGGGPGVEQDAIRAASALMAGAGSAAALRARTTASPGSRALLRWALAARLSAGSTVATPARWRGKERK